MKLTLKHILIACIGLSAAASCGFKYKELIYSTIDNVEVRFNWSNVAQQPASMRISFYPAGGGTSVDADDTTPGTGYVVQVPESTYDVLAYNNDTQHIVVENAGSLESIRLRTAAAAITDGYSTLIAPDRSGLPNLVAAPDPVYRAIESNFAARIPEGGGNQILTLTPSAVTQSRKYTITNIPHLEYARNGYIKGELVNVASSLYLGTGRISDDKCSIACEGGTDMNNGTVTGALTYFDCCENKDQQHSFVIYIWTNGGEAPAQATFDVTEMLHSGGDIVLDGSGIVLTPPESGMFDPTVGEWVESRENVNL